MSEIADLVQQALEQQARLLTVLETLAQTEAAKVQLELRAATDPWVDVETLVQQLGPKFSKGKILADMRAGLFKYGRDYTNVSAFGERGSWAFKKGRVEAIYTTAPEKRRVWPVEVA
jgi:hypothetical protein